MLAQSFSLKLQHERVKHDLVLFAEILVKVVTPSFEKVFVISSRDSKGSVEVFLNNFVTLSGPIETGNFKHFIRIRFNEDTVYEIGHVSKNLWFTVKGY
jgi:hypothetical protein